MQEHTPCPMAVTDRIHQHVQRLPERMQAEVLDFVEYLLAKAEREAGQQEERAWRVGSVVSALRGMEEEEPEYTEADLAEPFG